MYVGGNMLAPNLQLGEFTMGTMGAFIGTRESKYVGHLSYDSFIKLPSFESALATLADSVRDEHCVNIPARMGKMKLNDLAYAVLDGYDTQFAYTKHAFSQMVQYIKPQDCTNVANYLIACPPPLRAMNYNFWLDYYYGQSETGDPNKVVLFRTRKTDVGPSIVACVSTAYSCIDDVDLLKAISNSMMANLPEHTAVTMHALRGDVISRFHIYWQGPQYVYKLNPSGPNTNPTCYLWAGISILNSEVGASSLIIQPHLYVSSAQPLTTPMPSYGYRIIVPGGKIAIRHVGEAPLRVLAMMASVQTYIKPFVTSLERNWDLPVPATLKNPADMYEALRNSLDRRHSSVWYNLTNCHTLGGLISALGASVGSTVGTDIALADLVAELIGNLGMNGWNAIL